MGLTHYHPFRFTAEQPWTRNLLSLYRHHTGDAAHTTLEGYNALLQFIVQRYNNALIALPREQRPMPSSRMLAAPVDLFIHYARFVQGGRQVFDFHPTLIRLLKFTDSNDVRIDKIQFPYASIYLSIGPQEDLTLPGSQA